MLGSNRRACNAANSSGKGQLLLAGHAVAAGKVFQRGLRPRRGRGPALLLGLLQYGIDAIGEPVEPFADPPHLVEHLPARAFQLLPHRGDPGGEALRIELQGVAQLVHARTHGESCCRT